MGGTFFDSDSIEFKTVNGLSIAGSGLSLIYTAWLYFKIPSYTERVSLRIQIMIAFFDIIRHSLYLTNTNLSDNTCKMMGFLVAFCLHSNTFLNVAIAFNLQTLYVREKASSSRFVRLLYSIPISASIFIDLVPFMFDAYGRTKFNGCFLVPGNPHYEAMKILLLYSTNFVGLLYCFIIPVIVMFKLFLTEPDSEPSNTAQSHMARKLAFRISLYPLFCFICHSGSIAFNISLSLKYDYNVFLFNWLIIGQSMNGIINFICFVLDPYIMESVKLSSTLFFEPIKPEPETPPVLTSMEQDRRRFESEPPSEDNVPGLLTSDGSSIASQEIRTPDFLRTPVNSYSQSEPIHFLTDAVTIEDDIVAQNRFEAWQQTQVPHDILRFY